MYLRKNNQSFTKFQLLQGQLAIEIENSKSIDYCRITKKLIESLTTPKTHWSILKTFMNYKKIPCIPPIFHGNKFILNGQLMLLITSLQLSVH